MDAGKKKSLSKGCSENILALISNLYFFCNVFSPLLFGVFRDFDATISENFVSQFKNMAAQSIETMDNAIRIFMQITLLDVEQLLSEGLAVGIFDYASSTPPIKMRNYVYHVAQNIFTINTTLTKYRSFLTQRILLRLVEALFTNFYLEIQPIRAGLGEELNTLGYLQLKLELLFFQEIFKHWINETSVEFIQKIMAFIAPPEQNGQQDTYVEHLASILANALGNCNIMFHYNIAQ